MSFLFNKTFSKMLKKTCEASLMQLFLQIVHHNPEPFDSLLKDKKMMR